MTVVDPNWDPNWERNSIRLDGPADRADERAMLHHDVRGALQGVMGGILQIEASGLDGNTQLQFERVAAAARTLACLVGALTGEHPDADPAPLGVDLDAFLEHLRHRHAGEAAARGLAFIVRAEGDLPKRIARDPMALARIFDNLVGNAVKFAGKGTVEFVVRGEPDGSMAFRVCDEGPGIARDALERLFDGGPGAVRPDNSGHGLGLHVVRIVAEDLGGTVEAGNRPGGGFEVTVRFPATAAAGSSPASVCIPDLDGLRVLLAEDNPTNQMVASQMLRSLNAEVTLCSDGVEALERFEQGPFDLVVVDIEMPRLSGLDVIRAIRARGDARANVPIVALTAYAMREHRERIGAAGANGLISKPITSVEALGRGLAAHVARLSRGARTAPARESSADGDRPVIDMATFEALCEAIGADTMAELLDKVVADLLGAQGELVAALPDLDRGPIRSASHILISVAGALGAVRLQSCAKAVNVAAHGDGVDGMELLVQRCIAEIDAAVDFARAGRARL